MKLPWIKTEGLHRLNLECPICETQMTEFTNYGLKIESGFFGVVPYFCEACKKKGDYVIYNVNWRSSERLPLYYFLGLILLIGVIKLITYVVALII